MRRACHSKYDQVEDSENLLSKRKKSPAEFCFHLLEIVFGRRDYKLENKIKLILTVFRQLICKISNKIVS